MKTMIAIPCMDAVATDFCQSLVNMRYVGEVQFGFTECSLIYHARTQLCRMAMEAGADYVLWLDSDVIFKPNLMEDLMTDIQGKDMVTAIYHMRRPPFRPVIWKKIKPGLLPGLCEIEPYDDYPTDGLFEVEGCGFGAVLMKTEVIKDVAETFHETFGPIPGFGEDLSFCVRARTCGYKIHADPKLQIGHKGGMIINEDTFRAFRAKVGNINQIDPNTKTDDTERGEDNAERVQAGAEDLDGGV